MDATEIKDKESLRAWLEGRPREDAILIAQRAALRVWPVWGDGVAKRFADGVPSGDASLPIARAILTAGVARFSLNPKIRHAAISAAADASLIVEGSSGDAVSESARAKIDRATAAAVAARATTGKAVARDTSISVAAGANAAIKFFENDPWVAVREDAALLSSGGDLLKTPLWQSKAPEKFEGLEDAALKNLARIIESPNSFWHRWYMGAKLGDWLDWELQRAVALLPDEVWTESPAAVEREIVKIEEKFKKSSSFDKPVLTHLAKARMFDLVEHERQLRLAGVPVDFDGLLPEHVDKCLRSYVLFVTGPPICRTGLTLRVTT